MFIIFINYNYVFFFEFLPIFFAPHLSFFLCFFPFLAFSVTFSSIFLFTYSLSSRTLQIRIWIIDFPNYFALIFLPIVHNLLQFIYFFLFISYCSTLHYLSFQFFIFSSVWFFTLLSFNLLFCFFLLFSFSTFFLFFSTEFIH